MKKDQSNIPLIAYLAVIFATIVFAGESLSLRFCAKMGLPTGVIAFAQCSMAALVQIFFGARISKIDWKKWWPAIALSTLSGFSFYLTIRLAPAALVGLIEPLSLLPLMLGHRFIQGRSLYPKALISLLMLIIASCATVGQWPEKITSLAIFISSIGILTTGLALIAGEVVPKQGIPAFVLAMQVVLAICALIMNWALGGSSLAGSSNNWVLALMAGALIGLFVGLAVSSLYYGIQYLGALTAGTIKILRLPLVAFLAYIFINEPASWSSAIALVFVVIFSILTVKLSSKYN